VVLWNVHLTLKHYFRLGKVVEIAISKIPKIVKKISKVTSDWQPHVIKLAKLNYPPIANHNHPINSPGQNQAPPTFVGKH